MNVCLMLWRNKCQAQPNGTALVKQSLRGKENLEWNIDLGFGLLKCKRDKQSSLSGFCLALA